MGLVNVIAKRLFKENKKPGTLLGRYIVSLIPGHTVRLAVQTADFTFADVMENVYNDEGEAVDKNHVKAALLENKAMLKEFTIAFMTEVLAETDFPGIEEPTESQFEAMILQAAEKNFDKILDKLLAV